MCNFIVACMKGLLAVILFFFTIQLSAADAPAIAAASNLQFVLKQIQANFSISTGLKLRISYGSSGNFKRQIEQGAPFEMFLSADESYITALYKQERTEDEGKLYGLGRIVLYAPRSSDLMLDSELAGLKSLFEAGHLTRFAIANPGHAPYGKAAQQVLEHRGLWASIKPYLVLGENASQAAQFAASGSSQGGIIPYSIARAPVLSRQGTSILLPAEWHQPLRQRMVLLKNAGETAKRFYEYLQTAAVQTVFLQYGFDKPE